MMNIKFWYQSEKLKLKFHKIFIENQWINISFFIILTTVIYYIDWITGIDFQIYAFYIFPLFILSLNKKNNLPRLLVAALLIGILWLIEDYHFIIHNSSFKHFLLIWNGVIRLIFYGLIAVTFFMIKNQNDNLLKLNQKYKSLIEEREVLIKEVYHRVKNNMQIISSLLSLEKNRSNNHEIGIVLDNCISRIQSMSMIHEKLYRSANLARICVKDYIHELISYLVTHFNPGGVIITYKINLNIELQLDMNKMIPLGLILNELMMNSIKHAFHGKNEGIITISITSNHTHHYLTFSDDGTGFSGPVDSVNPGTLGLSLVRSLARQLDGNLEINQNKGTQLIISFLHSSE